MVTCEADADRHSAFVAFHCAGDGEDLRRCVLRNFGSSEISKLVRERMGTDQRILSLYAVGNLTGSHCETP